MLLPVDLRRSIIYRDVCKMETSIFLKRSRRGVARSTRHITRQYILMPYPSSVPLFFRCVTFTRYPLYDGASPSGAGINERSSIAKFVSDTNSF